MPAGTFDTLVLPESRETLTAILTYHLVAGKDMSLDLTDGMTATTANGAEVIIVDVDTNNGVVHAINAVLMPA